MKRVISLFLALVMVFTMLPNQVFASAAETEDTGTEIIELTEEPTEEPAETPTEAPAEEPTEAPAEEPTEAPAEEPTEAPAEEPAEEPTEAPAEEPTEAPAEEPTEAPVEEPTEAPVEEPAEAPAEEPADAEAETTPERICEEGCILVGEEEHLENGGECFVWIACTLTEGCEGMEGHEGECYGAALYDGTTTLTVSGSSYHNKYVVINGSLYYVSGDGTVQNTDGSEAAFEPGTYTVYYGNRGSGSGRGNESSFATGSVTVAEGSSTAAVTMNSISVSNSHADVYLYATSLFYNTSSFDHVDIRVAGSYVIQVGGQSYTATVSNPSVVVKVGGTAVASQTWSGTTTYEWRKTGLSLSKASVITVELVLDLTYTDSSGQTHVLEDVTITYDSVNDVSKFIDAIAICDMVQGLDFRVSVEDIAEEIQYFSVSYEWKVYNTDGSYTELPAGSPSEPATTSGHAAGEQYVYDTEYVTGTSFYDYNAGLLYTFHGWDTYSHSSAYNPIPSSGYYALDDGDTNAANNPTIEITADTYIYGYWTVTELTPSSAHIAIEKVFYVDGVEMTMEEAEDLWFRIGTGYDGDADGYATIDVDYPMIEAAGGEYKIPVYQYDTPFTFTEHNAEVPGYTRTTTITVTGDYIESYTANGDSVTVTMKPAYQGTNVHLGTVTYTNSYTRNVGDAVHVYPALTILKSAADTGLAQDGVGFTLYSDAACTTAVATVTTANGGLAYLDFGSIENVAPGTYYLKETTPLTGYHVDPCVYEVTLTASTPVEELRNGQYVQVTYYSLSVTVTEDSTASYTESDDYYRLHIYNAPVLGSLNVTKTTAGLDEADKSKLNAVVIVHGPIIRDSEGNITEIGSTWQLELNSANNWTASLSDLPLGEYLIHESFASVHGYTWSGVTYNGNAANTEYNNIQSYIFKVEDETAVSLTLANTYEKWQAADFYIKKVDENGNALAGAVFTLSTDEAGSNVVMTRTTGADGYAHFDGFTVPEGQTSVTYYLRETKAPAGYYLSNQVFKVVITAVTVNGTTSYEPEITLVVGRGTGFDITTDLLTVVNYPVLGELTITKAFTNGLVPEGLTGIQVLIGGPNGFSRTVELNNTNGWSATLTELALGEYTITELDANVPGYTWEVSYSSTTVTLSETSPGYTVPGTEISGAATITNTYTRNEAVYEVPAVLTVKKVGENGEALAGAVFTLTRMSADGSSVLSTVSFTTGESGTVVFDLLAGFIQDGTPIDGTYILAETSAPDGYEATAETWIVTVKEDNGVIRWALNENKNIFEGFWDWIVGNVSAGSFADGVLTIQNLRSRGKLTIQKSVTDPEGLYADAVYAFTLDCSDDAFDKSFTLKAGESYTVENIPWGTTYTLTEDTTGAAFTSTITDEGNGKIWAYETKIDVNNTYAYTTHNNGLNLVKVDADNNTKVIPGAGFTLYADADLTTEVGAEVFSDNTGHLNLPIEAAGTYYLVETTAPAGYYPNSAVYVVTAEEEAVVKNAGTADAVTEIQMHISVAGLAGTTTNQIDYVYSIENTAIKTVVVSVEKVWVASEGVIHPESVEAVLYRDGEVYDTVVLNAANGWSYIWTDLTDEYTWSVDEKSVPAGYTKNVTSDGYHFTITNTKEFEYIDVSVKKVWYGADVVHPTSVKVTLYRDGVAYDTVTLNAANGWTYTWKNLTDEFEWTVDEPSVPSGYNKTVRRNGYSFTITNTHVDNPKTGDFTNLFGLGTTAAIGVVGFGVSVIALLKSRKEEEEEQ